MSLPRMETQVDYNKIPQRLHKYPASDRARKIVHEAITMDTLFGTAWPVQWPTPAEILRQATPIRASWA